MKKLDKLIRVSLREAWKNEATEFTPWLAESDNLDSLSESLGLGELELIQTEYPIGDFRLDILCNDESCRQVIIENQLEKTNHAHLGQIITYASGIGAQTVIWVAESFRPEHIAAFEFLNQYTTEELNFFAVEIELWRIGESPMAPSFNVICKPNGWAKSGREHAKTAATATPIKQLQFKFWSGFKSYIQENGYNLDSADAKPQHWFNIHLGRGGYTLSCTVKSRVARLGVEVYIFHSESKTKFETLETKKQEIESALGFTLDWQVLPDSHACRIAYYKLDFDLENESDWNINYKWIANTAAKFNTVFRPILRVI
jgi:hypothetical protein